jgi:hypothetical protein
MKRKLTLLAFFIMLCTIFSGCTSEPNYPPGLPSGEITIDVFDNPAKPGARFDFETGAIVYEPNGPVVGDIYFQKKFLCGSGSPLNVGIQDYQPGSIGFDVSAPSLNYKFPPGAPDVPSREAIYLSHIYWIQLTDGKYAKIKIKEATLNNNTNDFDFVTFQWVYQPDGSGNFQGKPQTEEAK